MSAFALTVFVVKVAVLLYVLAVDRTAIFVDDTEGYVLPVFDLLERGTFSVDGVPAIHRTPGYPLFLTPVIAAFGTDGLLLVPVLQFLLTTGTAILTYRLTLLAIPATGSWRHRAATLAFGIVLLDPTVFLQDFTIATESLFTFVLVAGIYSIARFLRGRNVALLFIGFGLLSFATYVRPIGLYLPYLLAVLMIVAFLRGSRPRLAGWVVLALLLHIGVVGAWEYRNYRTFGVATFSTIGDHNLYHYIAPGVRARVEGRGIQSIMREHHADLWDLPLNPAERAREARARTLALLAEHPGVAAVVGIRGLLTNMLEPGTGELLILLGLRRSGSGIIYKFADLGPGEFLLYMIRHERHLLVTIGLGGLWVLALWLGVARGLLGHWRKLGLFGWLPAVTAAYLLITAAGPNSLARFRSPATPFLAVYAAAGLLLLWDSGWARRSRCRSSYSGIFPCFFGGFLSTLLSSASSAWMSFGRVSRG